MKKILVFLWLSLIAAFSQNSFADTETLTITVYYPAPYGIYNDLRVKKMAIGDTYYDPALLTTIPADTSLLVEGNVGIDTKPTSGPIVTPPFKLTLGEVGVRNGGILATGIYNGAITDIWPDELPLGPYMIWYPEKAAFRAGYNDASGTGAWNRGNIGLNSIAMGYCTMAAGINGASFGSYNSANGNYALALGAAHSYAFADYSVSIGMKTQATAPYSMVIGNSGGNASLINDIDSSLMVGFQVGSDTTPPAFFVGPSNGGTTTGNVGIGTKTPGQQLTITRNLEMPISTATTGIIYMADNSTNPATEYKFIRVQESINWPNTFIGIDSGLSAQLGQAYSNTAVGYGALRNNTKGDNNTAVGYGALYANIEGYNNTAVGTDALGSNTYGSDNTAIGMYALLDNDQGGFNTAIGTMALGAAWGPNYRTSNASYNVAIGAYALEFITTGSNNVAIGAQAGSGPDVVANPGITTGSDNVFIGFRAGYAVAPETGKKLYIANSSGTPLIYGDFEYRRIAINTTDTSEWAFKVQAPSGEGHVVNNGGWSVCSDLRLKKNIFTLQDSLYKLSKIRGVNFDFKSEPNSQKGKGKHIGFIGQELKKEFPELVDTDAKGYKSVAYASMTPVLVEAIKELKAKNDALEKNIQQRAEKIKALEAVLNNKAGK